MSRPYTWYRPLDCG